MVMGGVGGGGGWWREWSYMAGQRSDSCDEESRETISLTVTHSHIHTFTHSHTHTHTHACRAEATQTATPWLQGFVVCDTGARGFPQRADGVSVAGIWVDGGEAAADAGVDSGGLVGGGF